MQQKRFLETALQYQAHGFSVIPIKPMGKTPLVPWEKYQTEKATIEQIKAWWKKWPDANIGIVTGEASGICVIDIDSSEGHKRLNEYLPDNIECPIVETPRGVQHLYVKHQDGLGCAVGFIEGVDLRGQGGYVVAPPSIGENGKPYEWVQHCNLFDVEVPPMPNTLYNKIKNALYKRDVTNSPNSIVTSGDTDDIPLQLFTEGRRDDDLFHVANCLIKGGMSIENATQVLEILADNCTPTFPKKEVYAKIQSALKRAEMRERNIANEVREWVVATSGYFFVTDCYTELQLVTKEHRQATRTALCRLEKDGAIEKYGEKRGCYRLIDKSIAQEMTFIEGAAAEFDINLPFGLSDLVSIYSKNIVVIAGSKGSGKTSLALEIALANQHKHEVVYFNSEMGDEEWSKRLKDRGIKNTADIKFKAYSIHKNYQDRIDGSHKIYIVDYLEIHENFYEIAKPIRAIHEKLDKGVCVILIQKKTGERLGRGAEFSMEKSRLYLSLDYLQENKCTKLTIENAKAPKIHENLTGWYKDIKIIGGAKMQELNREWQPAKGF